MMTTPRTQTISRESVAKWLADWHEGHSAARMLIAAVGAYFATAVVHLAGPYTAVITTLIVARPHSEGVLRASLERVLVTVLGAGLACVASFGRLVHAPEPLLLAAALTPLAVLSAHNSTYRTSMIAAIIVLSAPAVGGSPLYVAGMRMLGVGLGAVMGTLVSATILPKRRETVVARKSALLAQQLVPLLRNALDRSSSESTEAGKLEFRTRQALRELSLLIRDRPDGPPIKGLAALMVRFTVNMHADIVFLKRELQVSQAPASVGESLASFARAFEDCVSEIKVVLREPATVPELRALWDACSETERTLREQCTHGDGARLMIRRLAEDLAGLLGTIRRASKPS
jgi:hypothetical protein